MPWHTNGEKQYFYRYERRGKKVRRRYLGRHEPAQVAARLVALRRAEQTESQQQWLQQWSELEQYDAELNRLLETAQLLTTATLLANAYHRPQRHGWRKWRDAERFLEAHRRRIRLRREAARRTDRGGAG